MDRRHGLLLAALLATTAPAPAQDEAGPFRLEWKCPEDSVVRFDSVHRDEQFATTRTIWHAGARLVPFGPSEDVFLEYWHPQKSRYWMDEVADWLVFSMPAEEVRLGGRWPVKGSFGGLYEIEGSVELAGWTDALGGRALVTRGHATVRPLLEQHPRTKWSPPFVEARLESTSTIDPARGLVLAAECRVDGAWRKDEEEDTHLVGTWSYQLASVDRFEDGELAERAGNAARRAIEWLEEQQRADGSFTITVVDPVLATPHALVVLLEAGFAADRPSVERGFAFLKRQGGFDTIEKLGRTVEALAVWGRDRPWLEEAVGDLLEERTKSGGWTFRPGHPEDPFDAESTAHALAGLSAAAAAGIRVPPAVWTEAIAGLFSLRAPDGTWRHPEEEPFPPIRRTAAALAGLLLARARATGLDPEIGQEIDAAAASGLAFLARAATPYEQTSAGHPWQIDAYGQRFFVDRFRDLSGLPPDPSGVRLLLDTRMPNGSWTGGLHETVVAIRSLLRVRAK